MKWPNPRLSRRQPALAQGDNLNPLLIFILLTGLSDEIKKPQKSVKVALYANDFMIYKLDRCQMLQILARFHTEVTNSGDL